MDTVVFFFKPTQYNLSMFGLKMINILHDFLVQKHFLCIKMPTIIQFLILLQTSDVTFVWSFVKSWNIPWVWCKKELNYSWKGVIYFRSRNESTWVPTIHLIVSTHQAASYRVWWWPLLALSLHPPGLPAAGCDGDLCWPWVSTHQAASCRMWWWSLLALSLHPPGLPAVGCDDLCWPWVSTHQTASCRVWWWPLLALSLHPPGLPATGCDENQCWVTNHQDC